MWRHAVQVLEKNWEHGHTVPSRSLYPHQWSWDSAFIAIGLRHVAADRARAELLSLMDAQWADGRVPHIVFRCDGDYFPGPSFWGGRTSGIVQPPVHALAAWLVGDVGLWRRIYPALVRQQEFLAKFRDLGGGGLAAIVHPWESGMDNSPAWDVPLSAVSGAPVEGRRDVAYVDVEERPTDLDYSRYVSLAAAYRDSGYVEPGAFQVEDPLFNSLYGLSSLLLAPMAVAIGEDPRPHLAHGALVTKALVERLWDGSSFRARDVLTGRLVPPGSVAGLVPLILPDLPVASELVRSIGSMPLPSWPPGTPEFETARYWRGPSWININWLILHGLRRHAPSVAGPLADAMVAMVARAGFREYFDPLTGTGHGVDDFSWTAALILDVLAGSERGCPPSGPAAS